MFRKLSEMISRRNPLQQAKLALARIISQYELEGFAHRTGVEPNRRHCDISYVAVGVWLFPVREGQELEDVDFSGGALAVTYDLRGEGFGVLLPRRLEFETCVIAVPDRENVWRFFLTEVRHHQIRPGGWHLTGLHIEDIFEPVADQSRDFREKKEQVETALRDVSEPANDTSAPEAPVVVEHW